MKLHQTHQQDDWNCAVLTLYFMEKALSPKSTQIPKEPLQLRARYIERLLMPCYDNLKALRHINFSRKRSHDTIEYAGISVKKPRILDLDIATTQGTHTNYEHILESFGSEWHDCYDNHVHVALKKATCDEVYKILVLASSVGSPQVLVDLHHVLQPRLGPQLHPEDSLEFKLYQAYYNLESLEIYVSTHKRLISTAMYRIYRNYLQNHENEKLKHKANGNNELKIPHTGHRNDIPRASTLAYDDIVAACTQSTRHKVQQDRKNRDRIRTKIIRICNDGKKFADFDDKVYEALGIKGLSDLLPTRSMQSPLGPLVKPDEYIIDSTLKISIH